MGRGVGGGGSAQQLALPHGVLGGELAGVGAHAGHRVELRGDGEVRAWKARHAGSWNDGFAGTRKRRRVCILSSGVEYKCSREQKARVGGWGEKRFQGLASSGSSLRFIYFLGAIRDHVAVCVCREPR